MPWEYFYTYTNFDPTEIKLINEILITNLLSFLLQTLKKKTKESADA